MRRTRTIMVGNENDSGNQQDHEQQQRKDREVIHINSALTLIVAYVEKVVNNNASNEDTKRMDHFVKVVNLLTHNDLSNALATIENLEARSIIEKTCDVIQNRMNYIKKISNLDAKESPRVTSIHKYVG